MRLPSLSNGLLSLGFLSGLLTGASGCSNDYGLFDVNVEFIANSTEATKERETNADYCRMTVRDDSGRKLSDYRIIALYEPGVSPPELKSGCAGGLTKRVVGDISYSTARSSGTLEFTVYAFKSNDEIYQQGCQSGSIKPFQTVSDEQKVQVRLGDPNSDPQKSCPPYED